MGVFVCLVHFFPHGNESAKKTYGTPQRCKHLNLNGEFFVKQAIRKATDFVSKLLAQLSAILFSLTSAQAYFGVLVAGFAINPGR